ncbi:MAG: sialate O-acetylesterase [Bacteroidales bacterium]|nr:sialate O-acetylesterase [Bacteroidales bacterium]
MKKISKIMLAAAFAAAAFTSEAREMTEFYYQRASLFEQLPVDSTAVVFLGNSLTNGCEWHELLGMPNAINRGISGDIAEGIDLRLDRVIAGHPAKIFFLCGVNDVSHDLTADSIASAVGAIAQKIRTETPQTKLYVQSLLPINNSFNRYKKLAGKEQTIRDINTLLKPMVEEMGATWIDLYPHFADEDGNLRKEITNDGLHLLGDGYLIWREQLIPYLAE